MESDRFGPYTVYECLGAGGMATVHRASIELEDDEVREVALKRMLPQFASDKRFVEDFIREGKLAAQLQHPNIVRLLELGRIGRTYFIVMDLVRGRPLMSLLRKAYQKKLPAPIGVVIAIMTELCDALEHAHDAQIIHRDLTPSNLIITNDGHLKIIDFGVAKTLVGNLQTSSGLAKGKLGYMSIEAIGGKQVDTRADIFSAGVVMWEMLASKRLFGGQNEYDVIVKVRESEVVPPSRHNPECPTELDDVVLRALAKSREDRWSSAGEMREAIDEVRRFDPHASAEAVVQWMAQLRADTARPRLESDAEVTNVQLSASDMFEVDEGGQAIADGSRRSRSYAEGADAGTYEGDLDAAIDATVDVAADATADATVDATVDAAADAALEAAADALDAAAESELDLERDAVTPPPADAELDLERDAGTPPPAESHDLDPDTLVTSLLPRKR